MPRMLRHGLNQPICCQIGVLATYDLGVSTGTLALTTPIQAPAPDARILKWWIKNTTKGTGTGTTTVYLVVNGGTSSTRQISDTIVFNQTAAAGIFEGAGWNSGLYAHVAADCQKTLDVIITQSTTAANSPGNTSFGVIWGY